jgi:hypothetical protein
MIFTNLHASSWSTVGQPKEKGLFDFDFITWMGHGLLQVFLFL